MKEQDYIAALKSIMGQAEMMVADIESKTPNVVERHDKEAFADEPKPKFEVGQWVVCSLPNNEGGGLACINEDGGKAYGLSNGWRVAEYCLRPAVPSDFERTVGNMKVRAYNEDRGGYFVVRLSWSDGTATMVSKAVAAALGYPVCPLSVSGGTFEAPK